MRLLGHWNWWLPRAFRRVPVVETTVLVFLIATGSLVAGCTANPILANPPAPHVGPPAATARPSAKPDPAPIVLPSDDAAHHRLTEWWYYTGHLRDEAGGRYGFEYVIFRAERGAFPVTWASHVAVTDESAGAFHYAQRTEIGPQVDAPPLSGTEYLLGLDLEEPVAHWVMSGAKGDARIYAALNPDEARTAGSPAGLGFDLTLGSRKPAVLHDSDGWIDFGAGGSSYYYSRTAMTARGSLTLDGRRLTVEGAAWFDHQWGDFIAVGGGGWDWFAVNLDDGRDLTLSLVRDADSSYPLVYGTLVDADGRARHLPQEAFTVTVTSRWRSPATGADYPAGWRVELPGEGLVIDLTPTVADQELDTRATTGVVYWEGSQVVSWTDGSPGVGSPRRGGGEGYVELTGYATSR
jgi:predicted secreted hydrolase